MRLDYPDDFVLRVITDICSSAALVSATLAPCSAGPSASDWHLV
jgi:hypothetical protein